MHYYISGTLSLVPGTLYLNGAVGAERADRRARLKTRRRVGCVEVARFDACRVGCGDGATKLVLAYQSLPSLHPAEIRKGTLSFPFRLPSLRLSSSSHMLFL